MKILVTGGAGFIGSAMCRYFIQETEHQVVNLDALTYAGDLSTLESISHNTRYAFEHANICDAAALERIFSEHKPDAVMHLAAESHVDRSIDGPSIFVQTNIVGTYNMLQAARQYWDKLPDSQKKNFRFHHISTDEVYGTLGKTGKFNEHTAYKPNSPYSASKASADHLVRAWHETFKIPVVLSNCSNNYGPYQFPEKLIPVLILNALSGKQLPIYGRGENIRDWLYVEDHVRALYLVLTRGRIGEQYAIGGNAEMKNIDIAHSVCRILNNIHSDKKLKPFENLITYVDDRPGHDLRYAIDFSKIRNELGWIPKETLETGLEKTVLWYMDNLNWCAQVGKNVHNQRLGNIG